MTEEHGPMERDLRRAWDALPVPEAPEDWRECDRTTRELLGALRQAWGQLEVPEIESPPVPLRPMVRRTTTPWLRIAAGILCVLGIGESLRRWRRAELQEAPVVTAEGEVTPQPEQPRIAALDSGRLEVLSGQVRLILLAPEATSVEGNVK